MIVGQNTLLNQYVPTFYIKDLLDGQILKYDSTRRAFINATGTGGAGGATRLGELDDVSSSVDNPLSLQNGQSLVYNSFTSLWENKFVLPDQSGNNGRFLTTNGTTLSWATITGTGTVTSVAASGTQGVSVSGSPITTAGTFVIGLGAITPTSIAATGTVTGSNLSGVNTGNQTIILSGDVSGSGTGAFVTTLSNTGVTANTYGSATQVPQFTVDAKGRITGVTNVTISAGTVTSVNGSGGTTGLTLTGGPITTAGTLTLGGTLAITNGGTGQTTSTAAFNALAPTQAGNAGRYLTTNGTTVSWGTISGTGTVTSVAATGTQGVSVSGSPITTNGTLTIGLGAITPTSIASSGTVTGSNLSGTNTGDQTITLTGAVTGSGTGSFATTYAGNLPVNRLNSGTGATSSTFWRGDGTWATPAAGGTVTSASVTTTPDISGTVATPTTTPAFSLNLTTTGVTANTYGSATQVPVFTVDAKGRISGVTNTAITAGSTTPEIVVWHYGSGGAGTFTPGDVLYSQTSGVTAAVTDAANCIATYTFTGKSNPPKSITLYGQNFSTNNFAISAVPGPNAALANVRIAGGGTAASPDLVNGIFSSSNVVTLQTTMANVGASSTIGNRAWLVVVFGF